MMETLPRLWQKFHNDKCLIFKLNEAKLIKKNNKLVVIPASFLMTIGDNSGYKAFQLSTEEALFLGTLFKHFATEQFNKLRACYAKKDTMKKQKQQQPRKEEVVEEQVF